MDIDTLSPGVDFRRVIEEAVSSCDVFIAVLGRQWLNAVDAKGRRRLDNGNDFVRLEIEAALARDIPVVPALVQGAEMPSAEELPETLDDFAHRNAVELSDARWAYDVGRLTAWLKTAEEVKARREQAERERQEQEAAEQAERESLEKEAAERAEQERLEREAVEEAERERLAQESTEQAERKRLAQESAEQAERERLVQEAAEQAERERLAQEAGAAAVPEPGSPLGRELPVQLAPTNVKPTRRWIRLRRHHWIAVAGLVVVVAAIVSLAVLLSGSWVPSADQRLVFDHIPAGIQDTCGDWGGDGPTDVMCQTPQSAARIWYRQAGPEDVSDDCFGEVRTWEHGTVCEEESEVHRSGLQWYDDRFGIVGVVIYADATLEELREEWRCCLQLE